MVYTPTFIEYKQLIENLSAWLTSTNANIHEVLQSVNQPRALSMVNVCRIFSFVFIFDKNKDFRILMN
jgi:hypothetical protein